MSKLKNHSGAKKRFKTTGSGLKMRSAGRNHILSKHKTKKKRHARGTTHLAVSYTHLTLPTRDDV